MDFLVAGLGFGALLIIAGYAVREVGVFLFIPTRVRKQFPENQELALAWRRMIRVASSTAMIGGGAMWLLALLAVAVDLSDGSGALAMAIAATIVSLAGAGVIAVAQRHMHAPMAQAAEETQPTARIAPQPQVQEPAPAAEDAFDEWRPRVIGRASSTIADDMPAWGATYSQDEEPAAGVAAARVQSEDEPAVEAAEPAETVAAPAESSAPESEREPELTAASDAEPAQPEAVEASEPAAADAVEEKPELAVASADDAGEPVTESELVADEVIVEAASALEAAAPAEPEPVDAKVEPAAEREPVESEVEAAAEPEAGAQVDDRVISEQPAPEPRATDTQDQAAPRRFKSSLLADIDEPGAGEGNAVFKSAILADLSGVRLPDDVPRFRPTTLIDPPAREKADDNAKPNGSSTRR